jgi:sporadic carbohydrate cluster protein (TIGR04323 family)
MNTQALVYTTPYPVNQLQIPIRVQVHYARLFAENNALSFSLPVTESLLDPSTSLFVNLYPTITSTHVIVFSRLFLATPSISSTIRSVERYRTTSNIFHFTYEDLSLTPLELCEYVDMVMRYRAYAKIL